MLTVEYVKNCSYTKDGSSFECVVKFAEISEELPFHATPNDAEEHGRLIYSNISAGLYGEIAPYAPPLGEAIPVVDVTPQ